MKHQPLGLKYDISVHVSAVLLRVPADFPSPAQEPFNDGRINLNDILIRDITSTFILRVTGDSMEGAGICDGDEVLVDRSLTPRDGDVVIAVLDGEFTVKRLLLRDGIVVLHPENPAHADIEVSALAELTIWGVVSFCIHHLYPRLRPEHRHRPGPSFSALRAQTPREQDGTVHFSPREAGEPVITQMLAGEN